MLKFKTKKERKASVKLVWIIPAINRISFREIESWNACVVVLERFSAWRDVHGRVIT